MIKPEDIKIGLRVKRTYVLELSNTKEKKTEQGTIIYTKYHEFRVKVDGRKSDSWTEQLTPDWVIIK